MHKIITNLDQFNAYFHQETCNPHVGIGDLSKADLSLFEPTDFGCYCVILMDVDFGDLHKQGECLRYKPGTIFTTKPGDVLYMDLNPNVKPKGKMLVFRNEMTINTGFGRDFYMFDFFNYKVSDALELTPTERRVMLNCYANIEAELNAEPDELTGHMLRLSISQMLSYCKRYYERQFDTRHDKISTFIIKLDSLLENYYSPNSELPKTLGFPTVAWCAREFHLAPNYFGNIVRRDLHISAQEYIHKKIVDKAKQMLSDHNKSVDQIAEELGFSYPNHFSRLFRNHEGVSPSQFRKQKDTFLD